MTTQSTFLINLTNLTTNTAYNLAKEKEPQLAHLKTKHGRLLLGDLQPRSLIMTSPPIWVLIYACEGPLRGCCTHICLAGHKLERDYITFT